MADRDQVPDTVREAIETAAAEGRPPKMGEALLVLDDIIATADLKQAQHEIDATAYALVKARWRALDAKIKAGASAKAIAKQFKDRLGVEISVTNLLAYIRRFRGEAAEEQVATPLGASPTAIQSHQSPSPAGQGSTSVSADRVRPVAPIPVDNNPAAI